MQDLTIWDFVLLPAYLFILNLVAKYIRARYKDEPRLVFYFKWGFRFKMLVAIVFTLLTNFYMRGDTVDLFYGEGKNFANIISNNAQKADLLITQGGEETNNLASPGEKGYLLMESNYLVVKISVILCFLAFKKYMIVNLLCAFIAFLGSWYLFLFFRKQRPQLEYAFAIACMAVPTVVFWSSGISKDAVCMASIGFLTWSLYKLIVYKKNRLLNLLIAAVCIYLIYFIKIYILYSYLPFCLYYLFITNIKNNPNRYIRIALRLTFPVFFAGVILYFYFYGDDFFTNFSSEEILNTVSITQENFNIQSKTLEGSYFTLGEFDGTLTGFLRLTPAAIGTTFFRPFIWEARNMVMLLSALESLLIFWFTIRNFFTPKGISNFFKKIFTDPLVLYCLVFSLLFAAFVGISSFNFGSLVRYKIPAIPFFLIALVIISGKSFVVEKKEATA